MDTIASIRDRFDRIVHLVHSVTVVDESATDASARTYATELTSRKGKPEVLVNLYHDRCVLADGRWLIAHRRLDVLYHGPPDLSGSFC